MPVPLIKARGQPCRMTENKNHCPAATPECGEWHGAKPCRMIPFPIPPGGWAGRVLETTPTVEYSSFWVGGWERSWIYIIFYVFALKCIFLKAFQAENGIFALFSPKIWTWTTMPLKVGFFPGFRGLVTD